MVVRAFPLEKPRQTARVNSPLSPGVVIGNLFRYRVKAAALPASTLRIFPVDFAAAGPARKTTASATSSGRTERLSRLRWR